MRIDIRAALSTRKTTDSRELNAQGVAPTPLTDAELDHVVAAGSKPGMVGDGRSPLQLPAAR